MGIKINALFFIIIYMEIGRNISRQVELDWKCCQILGKLNCTSLSLHTYIKKHQPPQRFETVQYYTLSTVSIVLAKNSQMDKKKVKFRHSPIQVTGVFGVSIQQCTLQQQQQQTIVVSRLIDPLLISIHPSDM